MIKSESWRIVEIILLRYPRQKQEYEECISDIMASSGSRPEYDGEYSKPQSVTEAKALKLYGSAYMDRMKKEIEAVELACKNLRPEEQKVIRDRYWRGRRTPLPYDRIPDCHYSTRQMKRIVRKTVLRIGRYMGEMR